MAQLSIHVYGGTPEAGGRVRVSMMVAASTGQTLGTDIVVDFARAVPQTNNAIIDAAKKAMLETYGVTVGGGERVALFGGVTSIG